MKKVIAWTIIVGLMFVLSPKDLSREIVQEYIERGETTIASWYDYTLNDIPWSNDHKTAASREFERGTLVEVRNVVTMATVTVLINDYGPDESVHPDRELDLSSYAFSQIADLENGLVEVEYREIGKGEYYPLKRSTEFSTVSSIDNK